MDFDSSRIERLKRDLYSRDESRVPQEKRTPVSGHDFSVQKNWGDESHAFELSPDTIAMARTKKDTSSFFTSFFGISLIFFALCLGVALFIFYGGLNMVSSDNVNITVTGPSSIASGNELDADVAIINSNHTDLINPTLYIDYPDGAESVGTSTATLSHDQVSLGTIASGHTADYSLRATFFGETNTVKEVTFRLEYSVSGSSAVFSKTKTYDISIGSSPLILNVTYPPTINSGQPLTLSINLTSNSSTLLPDTLVKVTYPYGFTYTSSNIQTQNNNSTGGVWDVGDLQNGDQKTLTVTGTLVGQDSEQRSFQVTVGTKSSDPTKDFNTELAASTATVGISKSFFNLAAGDSSGNANLVTNVGQPVPVVITWQNTLPDQIVNSTVSAVISGNVFDQSSVSTQNNGYYQSVNNTVTWNKTDIGALAQLSPGDSGQTSFSVSSLPDPVAVRSIKNPHINIAVTMTGTRSSDSSTVSSTANMTIRLQSVLGLSARTLRTSGPFTNTGPIPPTHDVQTTYTVTWTLTNTTNDVDNTTVTAILPQDVTWIGQTDPASETVNFDPSTRTVTWNAGLVSYGTGYIYSPRTVSFQVGLTPSITDVGASLPLSSSVNAVGTDTYASTTISAVAPAVTTLYSDASFLPGNDIVK